MVCSFYFPLDIIPEALVGPGGYVDDIAVAAYVLNSVINKTDAELVRRHWAGEGNVLDVIQRILKAADTMIGGSLWKKIKARF